MGIVLISVSYIPHYLVIRVVCPMYLIPVYLRNQQLEGHSQKLATSLVIEM